MKRLERLRSFFRFGERWLRENPTKDLKPPKVPPKPTLPFTDEEMAAILEAIDRYPQKNSFGYDTVDDSDVRCAMAKLPTGLVGKKLAG